VVRQLGPRSNRVYVTLRERILSGELRPGEKLPRYLELAADFGVAPMTVRQVLERLEDEGVLLRRPGRGTFVREAVPSAVLIVDGDPLVRALLCEQIERAGYSSVAMEDAGRALALLETDARIALILSAVGDLGGRPGVAFVRAARRRWPELPLAAVIASPAELDELHGTPECPLLILPRPPRASQVEEVLRLVLARTPSGGSRDGLFAD
jgi:DNA-binding transcriptional regulator YhcF (GntR family)